MEFGFSLVGFKELENVLTDKSIHDANCHNEEMKPKLCKGGF
jgi:hypothetical protein